MGSSLDFALWQYLNSFLNAIDLLFIGSFIYSFWAVRWINMSSYESGVLYYLVDLVHYISLAGLPLLVAIFCALMDIGDRLRERGQG